MPRKVPGRALEGMTVLWVGPTTSMSWVSRTRVLLAALSSAVVRFTITLRQCITAFTGSCLMPIALTKNSAMPSPATISVQDCPTNGGQSSDNGRDPVCPSRRWDRGPGALAEEPSAAGTGGGVGDVFPGADSRDGRRWRWCCVSQGAQ